MKPLMPLSILCLAAACRLCLAQGSGNERIAYAGQQAATADPDKVLLAGTDDALKKLEAAMGGLLVVFDSGLDRERARLGVPLATFADTALSVAYDVNGKGAMAQWKFSESTARGNKLRYQVFMGEAGALGFVLSAKF